MKKNLWVVLLALSLTGSLWAGTLAYWEFNEAAPGTATVMGQRIIDSSGNGRDLYVAMGTEGATTFVDPNPEYGDGASMGFTADLNRLFFSPGYDFGDGGPVAGPAMDFGPFSNFTLETLVRFPTRNDDLNLYCAPLGAIDSVSQIWWRVRNTNVLQFLLKDNAGVQISLNATPGALAPGGTVIPNLYDGNWHHWVIVRDTSASKLFMYVDYILVGSATDTSGTITLNVPWAIGGWNTDGREFVGSMDFMRISDAALTPAQFVQVKTTPRSPTPANGTMGLSGSTTLSWVADPNAVVTSQQLVVATDADFQNIVVDTAVAGSSYNLTPIDSAKKYYWRVDTAGTMVGSGAPFTSTGLVWTFSTTEADATLAGFWNLNDKAIGTLVTAGDQIADISANVRTLTAYTHLEPEVPTTSIFSNPDAAYGEGASWRGFGDMKMPAVSSSSVMIPQNDSITIEAVAKFDPAGAAGNNNPFFSTLMNSADQYFYGTSQPQYWFRAQDTGIIRFWLQNGIGSNYVDSITNVYDGKWHHFAAVKDVANSTISVYIDYTLNAQAALTLTGDVFPSGMSVVGGFDSYNSRNLNGGDIDFVKVTKAALTPAQFVQAIAIPADPYPADGATGIAIAFEFGWTPILDATITSQQVVVATDEFMQNVITTIPATGNTAAVSELLFSSTYYWRVDTTGNDQSGSFTREGQVWSFTTQNCVGVAIDDGDLNHDCMINQLDLAVMATRWLASGLE